MKTAAGNFFFKEQMGHVVWRWKYETIIFKHKWHLWGGMSSCFCERWFSMHVITCDFPPSLHLDLNISILKKKYNDRKCSLVKIWLLSHTWIQNEPTLKEHGESLREAFTWRSSSRSLRSCDSSCLLWSSKICMRVSRRVLCCRRTRASARSSSSCWPPAAGEPGPPSPASVSMGSDAASSCFHLRRRYSLWSTLSRKMDHK